MPLVVKDRVKESTTTSGTADFVLTGTTTGFQAFSVIGNGNTTYYTAVDGVTGAWEVGIGTYTLSTTTLSRDTVLASSASGAKVSFSSGNKDVFVTYPAGRSVFGSPAMIENSTTVYENYTVTTGNNALSAGPITINSGITVTVPSGSVWTVV